MKYLLSIILCFAFILPSNAQVDNNNIHFTAAQEECCSATHNHGMYWKCQGDCQAVLLCVHGLGLCAKGFQDLGKNLANEGINTYAVDVRGFGLYRQTDKTYRKLNLKETVSDLQTILNVLSQRYPGKPIFLLGESMGGSIVIKVASLKPAHLSGIICSAPAWRTYKKKRTILKALIGWLTFSHKGSGFVSGSIMRQATTSKELSSHWLHDESHRLELGPVEALKLAVFIHKTCSNAKKIDHIPVLIVQGLQDRLVKINGAAKLFQAIKSNDKELLLIADAEHLVFEEGQTKPLVAKVLRNWIIGAASGSETVKGRRGVLIYSEHYPDLADKLFKQSRIENVFAQHNQLLN